MELGGVGNSPDMEQDPKITLHWGLHSLEQALRDLQDGPAEQRVRRQFHQVLLAVERAGRSLDDEKSQPDREDGETRVDVQPPEEAPTRTPRQRVGT